MTKKDYERIARALIAARTTAAITVQARDLDHALALAQSAGVDAAARHIAIECAQENIRFDRDRFLDACGVAVSK